MWEVLFSKFASGGGGDELLLDSSFEVFAECSTGIFTVDLESLCQVVEGMAHTRSDDEEAG